MGNPGNLVDGRLKLGHLSIRGLKRITLLDELVTLLARLERLDLGFQILLHLAGQR